MLRRLVKSVLPEPVRATIRQWRKRPRRGLPPGLHTSAFEDVVTRMHRGRLRSVYHCNLRTWKNTGTFRLFLRFRDGGEHTLVYKRAVYSLDEIPANKGLPVRQGPPEVVIARAGDGPLAEFVPRTYWWAERPEEESFEYLWQDLNTDYEHFVEYQESSPITSVCESLADMHRALREQFGATKVGEFLNFDQTYSEGIWEYAMETLPSYSEVTGEPTVKRFLDRQNEVRAVFLDPLCHADRPTQVIHGDCNGTNMWVRQRAAALELKAVDWEWAGYGIPHADMISVLKWRSEEEKDAFLHRYCAAAGLKDVASERRWLRRANMERAILDASFLARQYQDPVRTQAWFKNFVRDSLEHLMHETTVFATGDA